MKEDIKQFLESGLLEEYTLGTIDPALIPKVENYIRNAPEVKLAYDELQHGLEILSKKVAATPLPGTKENILRSIEQMKSPSTISPAYQRWWAIAATLVAIAFCIWSILEFQQRNALENENRDLQNQYASLKDQCDQNQLQYAQQEERWMFLADPKTERYFIRGNEKAQALETVAYWNEERQTSYVRMLSLPNLPKGKCLQLWADVDGEMISLDVLPDTEGQIVAIPYKKDATSLNITIEPEGGSDHPTAADLVGSVSI